MSIIRAEKYVFSENEDTITIVDVTDKNNIVLVSRTSYSGRSYTHQGWLTNDHNYLVFGDEGDERNLGFKTTTLVLNVIDLDNPVMAGTHTSTLNAIDHNQYVVGDFIYQANYRAGLRILQINDIATADMTEIAYFDIYPNSDSARFNGAWGVYPFFPSGTVIISGIEQGLYVVTPNLNQNPPTPDFTTTPSISSSPIGTPSTAPSFAPIVTPACSGLSSKDCRSASGCIWSRRQCSRPDVRPDCV